MGFRVVVDRDACSGYANCLDAAPEIFDVDDHDLVTVIAESPTSLHAIETRSSAR